MAEALGKSSLLRIVKCEDLFAKGVRYHEACCLKFNLDYLNHVSKLEREGTGQGKKINSHIAAYNVVKEHVKEQITERNQVLQLSFLRHLYSI